MQSCSGLDERRCDSVVTWKRCDVVMWKRGPTAMWKRDGMGSATHGHCVMASTLGRVYS